MFSRTIGGDNIEVYEPGDRIKGKEIGYWLGAWYNWLLKRGFPQDQDVFFLRATRTISEGGQPNRADRIVPEYNPELVEVDKLILFPILNTMINQGTYPGVNMSTQGREICRQENDASPGSPPGNPRCTIDGSSLLDGGRRFDILRTESPVFDLVIDPTYYSDVVLDETLRPGTHNAISEGYCVCIKLPPRPRPYKIMFSSEGRGDYVTASLQYVSVMQRGSIPDAVIEGRLSELVLEKKLTDADRTRMLGKPPKTSRKKSSKNKVSN